MQKRIIMLFAINTVVVYGLLFFLLFFVLPGGSLQQMTVIGIAMLLMMIAPNLMINRELGNLNREIKDKTHDLATTRAELVALKSQFDEVTTIDELTGCYNTRHFLELLLQQRAMAERGQYEFTVAVLEVDQFSAIVEREGIQKGQEILKLFSRIVRAALREVDSLARFKADKFGLILSGASEEIAVSVMNRVAKLIGQIQITDEGDLKLTTSAGLTSFYGTETPEELIAHADKALEFAIEQGRDRVAGYVPPAEPETP